MTRGKNNKTVTEPDWIWWRKMSSLFGGPSDIDSNETLPSSPKVDTTLTETLAKRNRRATVHHIRVETPEKVESPVKERRSRGTPTQRTPITPKLDKSPPKSKGRTIQTPKQNEEEDEDVPEPIEVSVAVKSRRRTITHQVAQIEKPVETPTQAATPSRRRTLYPKAKPKESPKKVEETPPQIPFFENETQAAKSKAASESWDHIVTSTSSPGPLVMPVPPVKKTKELSLSFSVKSPPASSLPASSLFLDTLTVGRTKKRKTAVPDDEANQQDAVTPMETDQNSSPQTGTDECSSTAMFVENRLRACSGIKRQRIIFKIHELFYQEEVFSAKYD